LQRKTELKRSSLQGRRLPVFNLLDQGTHPVRVARGMNVAEEDVQKVDAVRRRSRLNPKSAKRKQKDRELQMARWETVVRDQHRCRLAHRGGCQGRIDAHHVLFRGRGGSDDPANLVAVCRAHHDWIHANGGREEPATLLGLAAYAEAHGIELVELHRVRRDGTPETLMGRLMKEGSRSLPIPVRMSNGAPGSRSCTADFKIRVIAKELKRRGATVDDPAIVALGISVDEIERAKPGLDDRMPYQFRTYPLLDLGLRRSDCKEIIREGGLPVPQKSSCYFCPFHDRDAWAALARDEPDLFQKSCDLEATLNARRDAISCHTVGARALGVIEREVYEWTGDEEEDEMVSVPVGTERLGSCPDCDHRPMVLLDDDRVPPHAKDHVYLTRFGRPLAECVDVNQGVLDLGMDGCDSGWCFT
jgi:hypothetical protein